MLPDFRKFAKAISSKQHLYLGLDDSDPANSHHEVNIEQLEKALTNVANGHINNILVAKGSNGVTNNHHVANDKGNRHHKHKQSHAKDSKEKGKEKESPTKKVRDSAKHGATKSPLKPKPPQIQMPKKEVGYGMHEMMVQ